MISVSHVCSRCGRKMPVGWSEPSCRYCGANVRVRVENDAEARGPDAAPVEMEAPWNVGQDISAWQSKRKKRFTARRRESGGGGAVEYGGALDAVPHSDAHHHSLASFHPLFLWLSSIITLGLSGMSWILRRISLANDRVRREDRSSKFVNILWVGLHAAAIGSFAAAALRYFSKVPPDARGSAPLVALGCLCAASAFVMSRGYLFWLREAMIDEASRGGRSMSSFGSSPVLMWYFGPAYLQANINRALRSGALTHVSFNRALSRWANKHEDPASSAYEAQEAAEAEAGAEAQGSVGAVAASPRVEAPRAETPRVEPTPVQGAPLPKRARRKARRGRGRGIEPRPQVLPTIMGPVAAIDEEAHHDPIPLFAKSGAQADARPVSPNFGEAEVVSRPRSLGDREDPAGAVAAPSPEPDIAPEDTSYRPRHAAPDEDESDTGSGVTYLFVSSDRQASFDRLLDTSPPSSARAVRLTSEQTEEKKRGRRGARARQDAARDWQAVQAVQKWKAEHGRSDGDDREWRSEQSIRKLEAVEAMSSWKSGEPWHEGQESQFSEEWLGVQRWQVMRAEEAIRSNQWMDEQKVLRCWPSEAAPRAAERQETAEPVHDNGAAEIVRAREDVDVREGVGMAGAIVGAEPAPEKMGREEERKELDEGVPIESEFLRAFPHARLDEGEEAPVDGEFLRAFPDARLGEDEDEDVHVVSEFRRAFRDPSED